jgi:hypothetical protein
MFFVPLHTANEFKIEKGESGDDTKGEMIQDLQSERGAVTLGKAETACWWRKPTKLQEKVI